MLIDPGAINLIQNTFLEHLSNSFDVISKYAVNLLYLFAVLELALFGLLWALQQNNAWEKLFFKIFKIGLIFFLIQSYPWIFGTITKSFINIGGSVLDTTRVAKLFINPAKIWSYGYDVSIGLLKLAASGSAIGLVLIQTILGMGILFVFGMLGIQLVFQIVSLYLVALLGLILLPFGAFDPGSNMLEKAVQNVFKAGARVMTLIIVIGIGMMVLTNFSPIEITNTNSNYNINQPLGLFFTALLFLYLAIKLPPIAAESIGAFSMRFGENTNPSMQGAAFRETATLSTTVPNSISGGTVSPMQAATSINSGIDNFSAAPTSITATASEANGAKISSNVSAEAIARHLKANELNNILGRDLIGDNATKASTKPSISENTLKKLHATLEKIIGS